MIGSCMKRHAIAVAPETTAQEAAQFVVTHHTGTQLVVDDLDVLVGTVRLQYPSPRTTRSGST